MVLAKSHKASLALFVALSITVALAAPSQLSAQAVGDADQRSALSSGITEMVIGTTAAGAVNLLASGMCNFRVDFGRGLDFDFHGTGSPPPTHDETPYSDSSSQLNDGYFGCLGALMPFSSLAAAGAVTATGSALDGEGGFGWSWLGSLLGTAVGALVVTGMESDPLGGALMLSALQATGAAVAYEVSSSASVRRRRARSERQFALSGGISPGAERGSLAASWRF